VRINGRGEFQVNLSVKTVANKVAFQDPSRKVSCGCCQGY
jgi:hypothetical protein